MLYEQLWMNLCCIGGFLKNSPWDPCFPFPNSNPSLCWILIVGFELKVMLCNSCVYDDSTLGYV